ncbi:MAG: hypothetical protein QOE65_877 [Solirubrobacteraceae bacterium]|nr:hypothetical protein [Solirubrobacteraceae bacterium]
MLRRFVLLVATASALALLVPASAALADGFAGASKTEMGAGPKTVTVRLQVDRFFRQGSKLAAAGRAQATLLDPATGRRIVRQQHVTFAVTSGASCKILRLQLDKLDLTLLGLNVFLDKVKLDVTGKRSGGVLGSLFCTIADQRISLNKAATSLNRGLTRGKLAPMAFTVRAYPQKAQSPATSCPVLALTLGPLHLELLGLVVDLNQVKLKVTAYRGQGALGDLFCKLGQP